MTKTRSIPYWTTSIFSSTVTDLVLIYESVTSSASVVRWSTLNWISVTTAIWLTYEWTGWRLQYDWITIALICR
jgi:hypothetical protein